MPKPGDHMHTCQIGHDEPYDMIMLPWKLNIVVPIGNSENQEIHKPSLFVGLKAQFPAEHRLNNKIMRISLYEHVFNFPKHENGKFSILRNSEDRKFATRSGIYEISQLGPKPWVAKWAISNQFGQEKMLKWSNWTWWSDNHSG